MLGIIRSQVLRHKQVLHIWRVVSGKKLQPADLFPKVTNLQGAARASSRVSGPKVSCKPLFALGTSHDDPTPAVAKNKSCRPEYFTFCYRASEHDHHPRLDLAR